MNEWHFLVPKKTQKPPNSREKRRESRQTFNFICTHQFLHVLSHCESCFDFAERKENLIIVTGKQISISHQTKNLSPVGHCPCLPQIFHIFSFVVFFVCKKFQFSSHCARVLTNFHHSSFFHSKRFSDFSFSTIGSLSAFWAKFQ